MSFSAARFCGIIGISATMACSSGGGGGGGQLVCGAETPVQCHDGGTIVGCCPTTHPVCSPAGCVPSSSSGGSGGGSGGQAGDGGAAGSTSGGTGGGVGGSSGAFGGSGGTSGSSGFSGSGGASGGTGGTPTCTDPGFEPNESEASATDLGAITDCDSTGSSVSAQLDGNTDTDFYVYAGSDVGGCWVDATATTGAKVRLCAFATCTGVEISCNQGSAATSPAGHAGCCVPAGGTVELDVNCPGTTTDSADVYIRVDQPSSGTCTSYTVDYHY